MCFIVLLTFDTKRAVSTHPIGIAARVRYLLFWALTMIMMWKAKIKVMLVAYYDFPIEPLSVVHTFASVAIAQSACA